MQGSFQFYKVYFKGTDLAYGSGKASLRLCGCVTRFNLVSEGWIRINEDGALSRGKSMGKAKEVEETVIWKKNVIHLYTMEYYSSMKKKEILPFMTAWMDFEGMVLSEIGQRKTNDLTYMCTQTNNNNNSVNEFIDPENKSVAAIGRRCGWVVVIAKGG